MRAARGLRLLSATLSFLLILAGCASGAGEEAERADEGGKRNSLTLMLDWYPNAVHSFLYVAQEKGYFQEEGVEVEILMPAETNDPLRLAAAKQVDIAFSYQPQVVLAWSEGLPLVSVAAVVQHPLNTLMVLADSPVQSPRDLEGKTVGYPSLALDESITKTMVQADGGDPDQVQFLDIGWDLIPGLVTQRADAVIGGFINHEKVLLEREGYEVRLFPFTEYGVPDYYELVLVMHPEVLSDKREQVEAFWRAAKRAQQEVEAHPEEALAILFANQEQSFPLEEDIEQRSLEILLPLMKPEAGDFGHQDAQKWQEVADWLYGLGSISQPIDVQERIVSLNE